MPGEDAEPVAKPKPGITLTRVSVAGRRKMGLQISVRALFDVDGEVPECPEFPTRKDVELCIRQMMHGSVNDLVTMLDEGCSIDIEGEWPEEEVENIA